jgi:hypothetical protein
MTLHEFALCAVDRCVRGKERIWPVERSESLHNTIVGGLGLDTIGASDWRTRCQSRIYGLKILSLPESERDRVHGCYDLSRREDTGHAGFDKGDYNSSLDASQYSFSFELGMECLYP